jgi:hypothetical protein
MHQLESAGGCRRTDLPTVGSMDTGNTISMVDFREGALVAARLSEEIILNISISANQPEKFAVVIKIYRFLKFTEVSSLLTAFQIVAGVPSTCSSSPCRIREPVFAQFDSRQSAEYA